MINMDNLLIPSLRPGDKGKFIQISMARGHRTYPLLRTSSDFGEAHSALIRRALQDFSGGFQLDGQDCLNTHPPILTSGDYQIRGMGLFEITGEGFVAYGLVKEYAHVIQKLNVPNQSHFQDLALWVADFKFRIDPRQVSI